MTRSGQRAKVQKPSNAAASRAVRQRANLANASSSRRVEMLEAAKNTTPDNSYDTVYNFVGGEQIEHGNVAEAREPVPPSQPHQETGSDGEDTQRQRSQNKGKGKMMDIDNVEEKVFPLMDLPAEIRLEIYRACLTRPYKILLSRREREKHPQHDESDDECEGRRATLRPRERHDNASRGSSSSSFTSTDMWANRHGGGSSTARHHARRTLAGTHPRRQQLHPRNFVSAEDPLIINLLRTSKQVYKEARDVLYSENIFDIDINTAVGTLAALHQRSRRHIKQVELEIPTYTEILERFSEIVRLSLRYCTGLKKFVISTPFTLPGSEGGMASSNTTVYANGFDILRWLPQQCEVVLQGNTNAEIQAVVDKHLRLAKTQDKLAYARRQLISSDHPGGRELDY